MGATRAKANPIAVGAIVGTIGAMLLSAVALALHRAPADAVAVAAGSGSTPDVAIRRDAAKEFFDAWSRSLTTTWYVESTFSRTPLTAVAAGSGSGATTSRGAVSTVVSGASGGLIASRIAVQRPPDRLTRQNGSISGRLGGRLVACDPDAIGTLHCRNDQPAPAYNDEVDANLALIRQYVGGPRPLYAVTREAGGCFHLVVDVIYVDPPWGQDARFCFDATTGAVVRSEQRRANSVDLIVATSVRPIVTDADFALPPAAPG